jgi:hypothetical protein
MSIKAACPKCNNSFDIVLPAETDNASNIANMTCACDHCGVEKRVAAFRKHHAWLLDAPRREAEAARKKAQKKAAAEQRARDKRVPDAERHDAESNRQLLAGAVAQARAQSTPSLAVATQPKETPSAAMHVVVAIVLAGFVYLGATFNNYLLTPSSSSPVSSSYSSSVRNSTRKWYQGGTLHKKSALEWQTASRKDKLATCADFVTTKWQNGDLKSSLTNRLSTVDDVRPHAHELVDFLDAAFEPIADPEQNRRLFANQTVSGTASIGMVMLGWTK